MELVRIRAGFGCAAPGSAAGSTSTLSTPRWCCGSSTVCSTTAEDGTRLRVRGRLDSAPDRYTGDTATRLIIVGARAQSLS
jgi:hypothetical protein